MGKISRIYRRVSSYLSLAEQTKAQIPSAPSEIFEKKEVTAVSEAPGAKVLSIRYGEHIFSIQTDQLDDEIISLVKSTLDYIKRLEEKKRQTQVQG
ncbi:MAG: hypothetical protein N3E47_05220 [Candidatus Bathyarchaeota archaeon]|nr:hypothetical protein [Candidatus Bathyarchaeota archaeon]